jgi:hypothetical protein
MGDFATPRSNGRERDARFTRQRGRRGASFDIHRVLCD